MPSSLGDVQGGFPSRYHIWTIGCQMNKADSERLAGALEHLGLTPAGTLGDADVVVLNSCVVRQSAEDKVVGTLGFIKSLKSDRPGRILGLMGCMVGPKHDDLAQRFPHVDVFMRPQEYEPLLELIGERLGLDWEGCLSSLTPPRPGVGAHVPIIHGCDLFCSFCIIPYRRGRQVSRPVEEVVKEVELLTQRGVMEVTLLGQTVDAYGLDLPGKPDLADLFEALHPIKGLARIRFLTSHPNFMSRRIIRTIASLEKVCQHINLPFQAGDDNVLESMRRGYTLDDYRSIIGMIREAIPGVALSTDVIVGFCGETAAQFQVTHDLLQELRFDKVHLAAYSNRSGTIASRKMEDDVPQEEKLHRLKTLESLQEGIASELNARLLGRTEEVLVDGHERGKWRGRTRTDKLVFFTDAEREHYGELAQVRITQTGPWSLQGTLISETADVEGVRVW